MSAAVPGEIPVVAELWREYWNSLGLPDDFQKFSDELSALPGIYAPPGGRLLLARIDGRTAGTVAFRRLSNTSCEMKRLYIRQDFRRIGVGGQLVSELVKQAGAAGYTEMYADTLPTMAAALRLYAEAGFQPTEAYSKAPTPGAVYLKLVL